MSCLLFIGVLILFFLCFFLFEKNILNPSVILCSVFLVSLFFFILNQKNWEATLHLNTLILIIGSIITFILGNSTVYIFFKRRKRSYKKIEKQVPVKRISIKVIILLDIFLIMLLHGYFKETYKLSLLGGNPGGYNLMLFYARKAILNFYGVNNLMKISSYFVKAISYICIFLFSYIVIFDKVRLKDLYLLSPSIIHCGFMILSTGRTGFIYLIIYILTVFFTLYQQKYNFDHRLVKKIIFYSFLSLLIFFIVFSLTGLLTGKTQTRSSYGMISIYVGSSIPALDVYINSVKKVSIYFGRNTLFRLYNILRSLGYNIPEFYIPYEYVYFNEMATNIYSALRRYHEDFGVMGLFFILFFLGLFYGIFFHYVSYKKNKFFILILYSTLCYPIVEFPIEERFFMNLFPQGFIYNIIPLGIIYYFFIYKDRRIG